MGRVLFVSCRPVGTLSPNAIHLPGIYVDRVVRATAPKEIEHVTLAPDTTSTTGASAGSGGGADSQTLSPEKLAALDARRRIARRAAKELKDGFNVNLGIGMPTLVPEVRWDLARIDTLLTGWLLCSIWSPM